MIYYNLSGRTKAQQEKVEAQLIKRGSLWPKIECLHKFIFTRKEFNDVRKSRKIIEEFNKKTQLLAFD